jgi:hypothetical protein
MWNIYGNTDRRRSLNLELGLGGLAQICQKAEPITSLHDETKPLRPYRKSERATVISGLDYSLWLAILERG